MRTRYPLLLSLLLLLLPACKSVDVNMVRPDGEIRTPSSFDHSAFDALLQTYVAEDGLVDYRGIKTNDALTPYLKELAATDPSNLSQPEQFAFWINAYNALTLKLIVDNYPTKSILRLTPVGYIIPKITTPFDRTVGVVGGEEKTLNDIEHSILRPRFKDPRLHFTIVCAAMSCPTLRTEAYTGSRLDEQFDDQGRLFLHDRSKNAIPFDGETIKISKIFNWFKEDFAEDDEGLQQFLAAYFEGEIEQKLMEGAYEIDHTSYDWTLNDQAKADEKPEPIPLPSSQ